MGDQIKLKDLFYMVLDTKIVNKKLFVQVIRHLSP